MAHSQEYTANQVVEKIRKITMDEFFAPDQDPRKYKPIDNSRLLSVIMATLAFERHCVLDEVVERLRKVAQDPTTLTGELEVEAKYWESQSKEAEDLVRKILTKKEIVGG